MLTAFWVQALLGARTRGGAALALRAAPRRPLHGRPADRNVRRGPPSAILRAPTRAIGILPLRLPLGGEVGGPGWRARPLLVPLPAVSDGVATFDAGFHKKTLLSLMMQLYHINIYCQALMAGPVVIGKYQLFALLHGWVERSSCSAA